MNPTDTTLKLLEAMTVYFQGEKIEALVFILPIGLLSLVFGAWLVADGGPGFARGVAIPFLLMGLLMSTVGAVVGYRTPAQLVHLQAAVAAEPQAATRAEVQRMDKVNGAWSMYLVMWAVFGVAGLALRFATQGGFTQGLGIALVFFAGVGLLVDGFAERRTHPYTAALAAAAQASR
ncbi:MAG: hypothetical protein FGM55_13360 [Rhodoferax sp.]|nr:hypothetical protein [Rhodoferax sp.]